MTFRMMIKTPIWSSTVIYCPLLNTMRVDLILYSTNFGGVRYLSSSISNPLNASSKGVDRKLIYLALKISKNS
jgi:hypothetical protein